MSKRTTSLRLRNLLPPAIALVGAAVAALYAATYAVQAVERQAMRDVTRALTADDDGWAEVATDGMIVRISGTAADEATRFKAITAASSVVDASRVQDAIEVVQPEAIEAPQFLVEILRNADGVSFFGLVPASTDTAALAWRIAAATGRDEVTDLLETADYPTPEGWDPAVDFALQSLAKLQRAKISVAAGHVHIEAITDSRLARATTEAQLIAAAPPQIELTLNILAPRPVITPYTLRAVLDENGLHFDACTAMTEEGRARILAAARQAGMKTAVQCSIGLGAPSTDWPIAVTAALGALAEVGGGSITFSDGDVTLVGTPETEQSRFELAAGKLENALPEGFSLSSVLPEPVDETRPDTVPQFAAMRSEEGELQMSGRLADEMSRTAVESYAHSRFGTGNVVQATRIDESLPRGWSMRVLSGLEALSLLNSGSLTVRADTLSLSGRTGNADAQAEASRLLSAALGQGADFSLDITYVEELDPLAGLPTADECIAMVGEVLRTNPKITFAPGSTEIEEAAFTTIDALAEVLRQCQTVAIEIGGHTDSQGRESMNLNLSQARADAVLNAIMERRVLTGNMTARGYGEEKPIADNGTEAGREDNRRIEFTLMPPEEAEEVANEAEEGDQTETQNTAESETQQ